MYVSLSHARQIVGNSIPVSFNLWVKKAHIPQDKYGCFPLEYLLRLKDFSGQETPSYTRAMLCALEWYSKHGDEQDAAYVVETVATLRQKHKILTTTEASRLLGYCPESVRKWSDAKFLPAVVVEHQSYRPTGRMYVYLREDVLRIREVINGLTSYEVGGMLGIAKGSVNRLVRAGKLSATMTPLGLRFERADVEAYIAVSDVSGRVQSREAEQLLGVTQAMLEDWAKNGHLSFMVNDQGWHLYDRREVLRIKHDQEVLRGDFEWLLVSGNRRYTPKQAARVIGTTSSTIIEWTNADLLPYFNLNPSWLRARRLLYVAVYIDELAIYMQQKPSMVQAEKYKNYRRRMAG